MGEARLHPAIHVFGVHFQDSGHPPKIEADAAAHRRDMAFERGAGAERHHRNTGCVAQHKKL